MGFRCLGPCSKSKHLTRDDYHYCEVIDEIVCFDCVPGTDTPKWRELLELAIEVAEAQEYDVEAASLRDTLNVYLGREDAEETGN